MCFLSESVLLFTSMHVRAQYSFSLASQSRRLGSLKPSSLLLGDCPVVFMDANTQGAKVPARVALQHQVLIKHALAFSRAIRFAFEDQVHRQGIEYERPTCDLSSQTSALVLR